MSSLATVVVAALCGAEHRRAEEAEVAIRRGDVALVAQHRSKTVSSKGFPKSISNRALKQPNP